MSPDIRHRRLLPLLIAGLATIGPFTIDTYLPSFPAIALEMGTTEVLVQQTLTAYLIPFAVMMLFHGAISDAVGRRPVILVGVGGFVIASIGCALAPNMHVLLICRAMQGLVAGASTSLSRAVVRDAYRIRLDRASEAKPRSEPFVGQARPLSVGRASQKICFWDSRCRINDLSAFSYAQLR